MPKFNLLVSSAENHAFPHVNKTGHNGDNQAIDVVNQKREKNGVPDIEDLRGHHNKSKV